MMMRCFGRYRPTRDLPEDVRPRVGESGLARLALDAAQTVGPGIQPSGKATQAPCSNQTMLALLAYCYAAGIYDADDIAWTCQNDPVVRSICGAARPDPATLLRFRCINRGWIEQCLKLVFSAVTAASLEPTNGLAPAPQLQPEPRADLTHLARRKLRLAIMTDTAIYE
jgi:hypothetical protein